MAEQTSIQRHKEQQTVTIHHPEKDGEPRVINRADYDPKVHQIWEDGVDSEALVGAANGEEEDEEETVEIPEDYADMKKPQLVKLAKALEVVDAEKMSKPELVAAIGEYV